MIVELSLFNYLIFLLPIFWDSYYERSSLYFWLYTFVFKSLLFIINRAIPYFFARHIFFCLLSSGLNLLTVSFFLVVCKWILLFYSLCLWQLCLLLGVFMFNTVIDMVGVLLPLSFWFFFFFGGGGSSFYSFLLSFVSFDLKNISMSLSIFLLPKKLFFFTLLFFCLL